MAHDTRTLSLCVKATEERPGRPSKETIVYTEEFSVDLLRPVPWNVDKEIRSGGRRYAFSLVIEVRRDNHEFFPGRPRSYIRFDVTGLANLVPIPPDTPDNWVTNTCWLDELTQFAGTWIRIPTTSQQLFIDLNIQFAP